MKIVFKFIFFLIISFSKKKRFILLSPNLTIFKFYKVVVYDKKNKNFFTYIIRDQYDYITLEEIFFYECYKIDNIEKYKENISDQKLLIIDCGSNIGCSTNYFLNTYKNSEVISIEPDVNNFNYLSKNVRNPNAILVNNAVSNEKINFEIKNSEENVKDNRGKNIIKVLENHKLKTLTINEILNEKKGEKYSPFLVKIDIEGHEKELFENNTEWFDKFKIVIIEIHDWMMPGKSISKNYLNTLVDSMAKNNRDIIIRGENLISIKH